MKLIYTVVIEVEYTGFELQNYFETSNIKEAAEKEQKALDNNEIYIEDILSDYGYKSLVITSEEQPA